MTAFGGTGNLLFVESFLNINVQYCGLDCGTPGSLLLIWQHTQCEKKLVAGNKKRAGPHLGRMHYSKPRCAKFAALNIDTRHRLFNSQIFIQIK